MKVNKLNDESTGERWRECRDRLSGVTVRDVAGQHGRDYYRVRAALGVHAVEQLLDDNLGAVAVRHLQKN